MNNILAAQKVIRYNQQFLHDDDISNAERRLAEIEQDVRAAIADCEEMKARFAEFKEKAGRNSLDWTRYSNEINEQEKYLVAYKHCLRIITGEQKLMMNEVL